MALVQNAYSGQLSAADENAWKARFGYFCENDQTLSPWSRGEVSFLICLMEWYQTRVQHLLYIEAYGRVYHAEHMNLLPVYENLEIPHSSLIQTIKGPRLPIILPFHTVCLVVQANEAIAR